MIERRAWLGLGSNLGDRATLLAEALGRLGAVGGLRVTGRSSLYETPPWGKTDQPPFLNAVAALATTLDPHALLDACLAVETGLGRRRAERWGPRTVDIDLLHMEGVRLDGPRLTLPHPELLRRAFVLVPLAEVAPELTVDGTPIVAALARLDRSGIVRVADPAPP